MESAIDFFERLRPTVSSACDDAGLPPMVATRIETLLLRLSCKYGPGEETAQRFLDSAERQYGARFALSLEGMFGIEDDEDDEGSGPQFEAEGDASIGLDDVHYAADHVPDLPIVRCAVTEPQILWPELGDPWLEPFVGGSHTIAARASPRRNPILALTDRHTLRERAAYIERDTEKDRRSAALRTAHGEWRRDDWDSYKKRPRGRRAA